MTLGFSTVINKKESLFPEKIIRSLDISEPKKMTQFDLYYEIKPFQKWLNINDFFVLNPKLHTIRKDEKDRWKVGNDIHFVINNRTKDRFQFAPITKVKSIQKIEMVIRGIKNERPINVYVDGQIIGLGNGLEELALNDGFDSLEEFYNYFKDGFKGKIIHWTDAQY